MFDLIKLRMINLAPADVQNIVDRNHLQTNTRGNTVYYDNSNVRNVRSFYISVTAAGNLRIEGSLHKFWNYRRTGRNTNHDLFTMSDAVAALALAGETIGIDIYAMQVKYYEIGLNLYTPRPPIEYMREMQTIGTGTNIKRLYINPRYGNQAVEITEFYDRIKIVYKAYDKRQEMRAKRREDVPDFEILRIESIRKRVEKTTVRDLIAPGSIDKLTRQFLREWRSVTMRRIVRPPSGTHETRLMVYQSIVWNGLDAAREAYESLYQAGQLTRTRIRTIRDICDRWPDIRKNISLLQTENEIQYRSILLKSHDLAKL